MKPEFIVIISDIRIPGLRYFVIGFVARENTADIDDHVMDMSNEVFVALSDVAGFLVFDQGTVREPVALHGEDANTIVVGEELVDAVVGLG